MLFYSVSYREKHNQMIKGGHIIKSYVMYTITIKQGSRVINIKSLAD